MVLHIQVKQNKRDFVLHPYKSNKSYGNQTKGIKFNVLNKFSCEGNYLSHKGRFQIPPPLSLQAVAGKKRGSHRRYFCIFIFGCTDSETFLSLIISVNSSPQKVLDRNLKGAALKGKTCKVNFKCKDEGRRLNLGSVGLRR